MVSWGTLSYSITVLAEPIHQSSGWTLPQIFLGPTIGMMTASLVAGLVGRMLQRLGGRTILTSGSAAAGTALIALGQSTTLFAYLTAWVLVGLAMAATHYDAAFCVLREAAGSRFRRFAAWLTICGGLASTVFWPTTAWLTSQWGWRASLMIFGAIHLFGCAPLHYWALNGGPGPAGSNSPESSGGKQKVSGSLALAAMAFSLAAFSSSATTSHLSLFLAGMQSEMRWMVFAAIGPMQSMARIVDLVVGPKVAVRALGMAAFGLQGLCVLALAWADSYPWLAIMSAALFGYASGITTIARALVPGELLARDDYTKGTMRIAMASGIVRSLAPVMAAQTVVVLGPNMLLTALGGVCFIAVPVFRRAFPGRPKP